MESVRTTSVKVELPGLSKINVKAMPADSGLIELKL